MDFKLKDHRHTRDSDFSDYRKQGGNNKFVEYRYVESQKPAVIQPRHQEQEANSSNEKQYSHTKAGHRDMRPAVFIKDLKKRAIKLEEEKSEHHNRENQKSHTQKDSNAKDHPRDHATRKEMPHKAEDTSVTAS